MKINRVFLFLILFLLAISPAYAVVSTTVDAEPGFNMRGLSIAEDGTILAYGSYGDPMNTRGAILKLGLDGSSENVTPASDTHEGHYRGVIWLEEDHMIALRSVPNDPTYAAFSIAEFIDGQMTWHTEPTDNMFFIEPVDNNFFAYCKPAPVTSEIWNVGLDGTIYGKLKMKERIILSGILIGEEKHIAYGEIVEDPKPDGTDQKSDTLIFCFDNDGDILWRHGGSREKMHRRIKGAVWAADGGVICIENYSVVKYDATGEVWRMQIEQGDAEAILPVGEAYWVFGATEDYQGMQIICINDNGRIVQEMDFPDINTSNIFPFMLDGEVYAVIEDGRDNPLQLAHLTDAFG